MCTSLIVPATGLQIFACCQAIRARYTLPSSWYTPSHDQCVFGIFSRPFAFDLRLEKIRISPVDLSVHLPVNCLAICLAIRLVISLAICLEDNFTVSTTSLWPANKAALCIGIVAVPPQYYRKYYYSWLLNTIIWYYYLILLLDTSTRTTTCHRVHPLDECYCNEITRWHHPVTPWVMFGQLVSSQIVWRKKLANSPISNWKISKFIHKNLWQNQ